MERVTTKRITQSTHRMAAAKVAQILGEDMKLKADGAGGERTSREPRQSDHSLALVHPQLPGPAFVVEGDGIGGRPPPQCHSILAATRRGLIRVPAGWMKFAKEWRTSFGGRPTGRVSKWPIRSCSTRLVGSRIAYGHASAFIVFAR